MKSKQKLTVDNVVWINEKKLTFQITGPQLEEDALKDCIAFVDKGILIHVEFTNDADKAKEYFESQNMTYDPDLLKKAYKRLQENQKKD